MIRNSVYSNKSKLLFLLESPNEKFLENAYLILLERGLDKIGVLHYAQRLDKGIPRKVILAEIGNTRLKDGAVFATDADMNKLMIRYMFVRGLPLGKMRWLFLPRFDACIPDDSGFDWINWASSYFSEACASKINFPSSCVFSMTDGANGVRYYPKNSEERYEDTRLQLDIVETESARHAMLERVILYDPDLTAFDAENAWEYILIKSNSDEQDALAHLWDVYEKTFTSSTVRNFDEQQKNTENNRVGVSKYTTLREAFDEQYYLNTYPDIKEAGVDPYDHYSNYGSKEMRRPNSWFDPAFYLEAYSDVKKLDIEPLAHYVNIGQFERRLTNFKIQDYNGILKRSIPTVKYSDIKEGFVEYVEHPDLNTNIKLIAFYLPQFHPFPENDKWWGKGFTEWTNVTKAKPNFDGHYQPHLPIHVGFYDLRVPEVMIEQAKLARNYGIYGFNFYYYWFDGKTLMQRPLEILLEREEIDVNFCITWANENWTRRWDGSENDILIAQNHCDDDSIKFIESLYKFFNDKRYIRIDNKPILIIYRADIIPNMKETVGLWRTKIREAGFDGLYIICAQTFGITSPDLYGCDAAVEFPPHTVRSDVVRNVNLLNNQFEGAIFDYQQVVINECRKPKDSYKKFKTVMFGWDNTARKKDKSHIFYNFKLIEYNKWLSHSVCEVFNDKNYSREEKIVFINAWNEWAEGTHLEPDRKYGYGYLQATYESLITFDKKYEDALTKKFTRKIHEIAVIIHIHYTELWDEINFYLKNLVPYGFDLFVTITSTKNSIIENILDVYPNANIRLVENRGRDVLPFIETYKKLINMDYKYVCKMHSKKSEYRIDGEEIRSDLYSSLLGGREIIDNIFSYFEQEDNKYGLVVPKKYIVFHNEKNMRYNQDIVDALSVMLGLKFDFFVFPAGSMFWFMPEALSGIELVQSNIFQPEEGLADGTISHGFERILCNLVRHNNFKM